MMGDYLLIVPLVLALAIGWLLGRRDRRKQQLENYTERLRHEYFSGLNHLIDNNTDEAIESFISALKYNSETVPIRLALGTLFRRRGEVQRSIQLHQEVLALPSLTAKESVQVQLALAHDYMAAGLLDRAENLLLELLGEGSREDRDTTVRLLIDLYQQEKEWHKALKVAELLSDDDGALGTRLAHYHCELARVALQRREWQEARKHIKGALQEDPDCVRASLLNAELEMTEERWKAAIKSLKSVPLQDPAFVSETVPLLAECYRRLNATGELRRYLEQTFEYAPSTTAMLLVADEIAREQGDYQAGAYITEQLKLRPSVKGFNRLIDLHLKHAGESARESLGVLRGLTGQLEQSKPVYHCRNCGFSGQTLHWQCPSCQGWGEVRPIQGLEGE
ncbi:lipopolysaccharide assembly protein LapB [Motiliproteus sp. SC1-56]|uniref:lipopolysaccharide assembly protein LapB n=1 Tax=Motiliproteus sp. SC1-56 TaxID=2799565 RepID=UPI001F5D8186|nr:lipopolysaccharide assembly protein LapB [Motiliproteus sp. SC1-56]